MFAEIKHFFSVYKELEHKETSPEAFYGAEQARQTVEQLVATPERETQGAFLRALRAREDTGPLLLLVDEAPWRARFDPDPRRLEQRRAAWRSELVDLAELGLTPAFLDLAQADLRAAQDEIERRLEGSA